MKKVFGIALIGLWICLSSCNNRDNEPDLAANGPWDLVRIEEAMSGTVWQGDNLIFREKYQFNGDGSFSKTTTRIDGGTGLPFQGLGRFFVIPNANESQLINLRLVYEVGQEASGSCDGSEEETLYINADYQLINDQWAICDGPLLYYERLPNR